MQTSIQDTIKNAELNKSPLLGKDTLLKEVNLGYACEIGNRTNLSHSTMDDFSYIANDAEVINTTIGKFCSIAAHTRINPGNHPLDRVAMHHFTYRASRYGFGEDEEDFFNWRASKPVTIGHDVWLGHGVIILAGVTIGNGAAIGAGSIVTKDVPPYSIIVGNPGKILRPRFSDKIIQGLEALEWWNWPPTLLAQRLQDFRQLSAEQFIKKYST